MSRLARRPVSPSTTQDSERRAWESPDGPRIVSTQTRPAEFDSPDITSTRRAARLNDFLTARFLTMQLLPARVMMTKRVTLRDLAFILGIAAGLRFFDLGAVGLNSDEAVYAGQSASLAGNPHFTALFPIVRAHPLLLQLVMAPLYRSGIVDTPGRYVAATFGVATVALVYVLGRVLY